MRKLAEMAGLGGDSAKLYRNSEWKEFVVQFYKDGIKQDGASYHCTDKQEAIDTANAWLIAQDDKRRK